MKIRVGFVSNSSSCSFVIAKHYMTEKQVQEFSYYIKQRIFGEFGLPEEGEEVDPDDLYDAKWIETDFYFHGDIERSIYMELEKKLLELGVDEKYISTSHD